MAAAVVASHLEPLEAYIALIDFYNSEYSKCARTGTRKFRKGQHGRYVRPVCGALNGRRRGVPMHHVHQ